MKLTGGWILFLFVGMTALAQTQHYVISTYAGGGLPPTPAAALSMSIGSPQAVATDAAGNAYFISMGYVFKLDQEGIVTRIAGTFAGGYSGDGGPATSAQLLLLSTQLGALGFLANTYFSYLRFLLLPPGLAVDNAAGNVFIADNGNARIRKISLDGIITTVAGNGTTGFSGDGGLATSAQLSPVLGLAVDASGNLLIADSGNSRIRQITPDGIITTVAGDGSCGFSGDNGPAGSSQLCGPAGIAIDRAGNLFVADSGNNRIRKISPGGNITTVAGTGSVCCFSSDSGLAISAAVWLPTNVAVDSAGNLFIAQATSDIEGTPGQMVRKVSTNGVITTLTSQGCPDAFFWEPCYDGTTAAKTFLSGPLGLAVDGADNGLLIVGFSNRVGKLSSDGTIVTVAGDGTYPHSGDGGPAISAQLASPEGVAVDAAGNVFIADYGNARIRKVSPDGIITTVAGNGKWGSSGDGGAATMAELAPFSVAADGAGNLFFFDVPDRSIRKISPDGIITTVIVVGGNNDYVALDSSGDLFIACPNHTTNTVCKISPDGIITTVAGNGIYGDSGDGGPAISAQLAYALGVAVDSAGNLFIADASSNRIRKVAPDSIITTIAGNGKRGFSGDGGPATEAQLSGPEGVAVDAAGNVFIADYSNARIRRVSPDGIITTIAGNGKEGFSGDGGAATDASISAPFGIAVDRTGNVYFSANGVIRVLRPVK